MPYTYPCLTVISIHDTLFLPVREQIKLMTRGFYGTQSFTIFAAC